MQPPPGAGEGADPAAMLDRLRVVLSALVKVCPPDRGTPCRRTLLAYPRRCSLRSRLRLATPTPQARQASAAAAAAHAPAALAGAAASAEAPAAQTKSTAWSKRDKAALIKALTLHGAPGRGGCCGAAAAAVAEARVAGRRARAFSRRAPRRPLWSPPLRPARGRGRRPERNVALPGLPRGSPQQV